MFRFVLLLFCLLVPAYSCDWLLDASGCAEKVVEDAASKIIPEARDAFEEAMSQVFQKDINPLIDKLQTIFETEEQQVFADVNKTVDHIRDAIDEIVDHAAEVAEQLVNNTKAAVEEIINDAAQKMEDVEKQFFNDVSSLLNKIEQLVKEVDCDAEGYLKKFEQALLKFMCSPALRVTPCWKKCGLHLLSSCQASTESDWWCVQSCEILEKVTPTTPIDKVVEYYGNAQELAGEYRCAYNLSPIDDIFYTKKWVEFGVDANTWKASSALRAPLEKGGASIVIDDDCGTPMECLTKAMQIVQAQSAALNDAMKQIWAVQANVTDDEKRLTTLENRTTTIEDETQKEQAGIKTLQAAVAALSQTTSTLTQTTSTLTGEVAKSFNNIQFTTVTAKNSGSQNWNVNCPSGYFLLMCGVSSSPTHEQFPASSNSCGCWAQGAYGVACTALCASLTHS